MNAFHKLALTAFFTFSAATASADVVAERTSNFSASGKAMRAMGQMIGSGDLDSVAIEAEKLAAWADMIPNHFPAGSESRGANPAIWSDFETFTQLSLNFGDAARALMEATKTGDAAIVSVKMGEMGGTCKACHRQFKN